MVDQEVAAILEEVRRQVHTRQALGATDIAAQQRANDLQAALQDVHAYVHVNAHLPLLWEDPIVGRLRAYAQRAVRRLLRWYINPIIDQQNAFNVAIAKALELLEVENTRLRRELAQLDERLSALTSQKETQ